jgi:uncharacterized RDD family membrane protein YckC
MYIEYKMIGGDGREYGPAPLEEMKSWIREGRVSGATLIWRSDSPSWVPASQFTEFQPELGGAPQLRSGESFMEPVGFWPRLAAYIIDRIALGIVSYMVWTLIANAFGWQTPQPPTTPDMDRIMKWIMEDWMPYTVRQMAIYLPMHLLYEVLMNGRWGATLGKMVIGARIVRQDGSAIGYSGAFVRWWAERLSDMTCYIGYLFVAFRDDKRALHDLICGTRVIYKR